MAARTILFIHGMFISSAAWQEVAGYISELLEK